ncbi:fimbrial protein [Providencia alcalifaciens]|uniref:fimbrial protein n=1 Tax=Providencia alcalifaciens TaxID=126385 RepID=UPI0022761ECE|nr:fimbrial protein [Providencia rettgeri]ELR5228886.1 fimbrial protein [Providencia rettgeri]ELY3858001.1 fimbrial protein [Providencia rettgeri]MCY0802008.1 fimbrial protein [Providencia rettgeri]
MFKKSLLALSLITLSSAAFSAPVANLKVTGSITPPTCTVNGEEEADVLYQFDITPGIFPTSGNLVLEPKTQPIEVICDATTYLTFDASDSRDGTALSTGNTTFGLGTYGEDNLKVGFFTVTMQNATVKADAQAAVKTVGVLNGTGYATSGVVDKTKKMGWGTAANTPAAGQIFAADFAVKPTINSEMKNTAGDATLNGHAVLAFTFGL